MRYGMCGGCRRHDQGRCRKESVESERHRHSLDKLAQSFIAKSTLPDTLRTLFRSLADWRNVHADAHGHVTKDATTEAIARNFIAVTASLVVLIQSEIK